MPVCPQCELLRPQGNRFCHACGAELLGDTGQTDGSSPATASSTGSPKSSKAGAGRSVSRSRRPNRVRKAVRRVGMGLTLLAILAVSALAIHRAVRKPQPTEAQEPLGTAESKVASNTEAAPPPPATALPASNSPPQSAAAPQPVRRYPGYPAAPAATAPSRRAVARPPSPSAPSDDPGVPPPSVTIGGSSPGQSVQGQQVHPTPQPGTETLPYPQNPSMVPLTQPPAFPRVDRSQVARNLTQRFWSDYEAYGLQGALERYRGPWRRFKSVMPYQIRNASVQRVTAGNSGAWIVIGIAEYLTRRGEWRTGTFSVVVRGGELDSVAIP